jgi:Fic family protein
MGIFTTLVETVAGDDTEVDEKTANERDRPNSTTESAHESRPATPYQSEADFVVETGRTRKEALLELVEAHGGRVKQVELVDLTGWSKSTVSRLLGELENDGAINRIPIGRCKVVLLPDESLAGDQAISYDAR